MDTVIYLGSHLTADGSTDAAVARRIGEARHSFVALNAVWKHTSLSRKRKLDIFDACVVSKLLFSLEPLYLKTAARKCVDAFRAACLRRMFGILHPMLSRISNDQVRRVAERERIIAI